MKFHNVRILWCAMTICSLFVFANVAQARESCIVNHSVGFCRVKQDRVAIKIIRKKIVIEMHRTHHRIKLKPMRRLSWNESQIHKANQWHRHLLGVLRSEPTFFATPQDYAEWLGQTRYGWGPSEFHCQVILWNRESSWRVFEVNSIGASGIPQRYGNGTLPDNWYDPSGQPQIRWGDDYISGRYGTPCNALSHSYQYNYY